ncbi:MAG: RNA polymerase factor sigma-54 [Cytophagales bacterium]
MMNQTTVQRQTQKLSPLQIQMLNLLHLSSQELALKIKDELVENPALETGTDESDESSEDANENEEDVDFNENDDDYADFYQPYEDEIPQYKMNDVFSQNEQENYFIPFANCASFYERIKEQIAMLKLTDKQKELASFLVDSLDDDGYLRTEIEELTYQYSFSNGVMIETEEMEVVLKEIQNCDPPGIGARSLSECLLIQLKRKMGSCKNVDIAYILLENYAAELENRNYTRILKSLKITAEELKNAITLMTKLNPKPNVVADSSMNINHVIPEFLVTAQDGALVVSLTSKYIPEVKLNPKIMEMMRSLSNSSKEGVKNRNDKSTITFMKSKISSAQWLVDALKQRETTMMTIINVIASIQYDFFMSGDFKDLHPMILKNVADKAGLDISSVSRVTSNKYVQSDFGTFLLKELFSEGMTMQTGEIVSNKEIKNIMQEMMEEEDKDNPFTDMQISEILKTKGYNVARRTVAKYRDKLNISGAKMRRELV